MSKKIKNKQIIQTSVILIMAIFASLIFNIEHVSSALDSDYLVYLHHYEGVSAYGIQEGFKFRGWEPGYIILAYFFSRLGLSFENFLFLLSTFLAASYYFFSICVFKKIFPAVISTLIFLISPFYESFFSIVIRQGFSIAFLLLSFYFYFLDRKLLFFIFSIIAISIHYSSIFVFIIFILAVKFSPLTFRVSLMVFLVSVIFYVLNFSYYVSHFVVEPLIGLIGYAGDSFGSYAVGFKFNFLVLTIFGASLIAIASYKNKISGDATYLAKFFFLLSSVYMLSSWLPYHDRIAIVTWIMIPIFFVAAIGVFKINLKKNYGNT